ncbi:deleted in lung and esophageal cancer protein 1 [Microcaecilia unicolor]|uniref:Deleted in lung and esophageal cancer protein 1 n=1 Tax=Microcaecilia unicolor TaxID=1415580 RepID=A0A6P7XKS3_9AMPH|nr:deleted in lung and esophageal cancer protein 1 [Microcaecilia unicolor]
MKANSRLMLGEQDSNSTTHRKRGSVTFEVVSDVEILKMQRPEGTKMLSSPFPSMFRPKPLSERSQDISHLLTSMFKNVYTGDVIGKDKGTSLLTSRGGDNLYHEKFLEELSKVHTAHSQRMRETDMVEQHIIQARARATAEEERAINMQIEESGERFADKLPPVDCYFRWCVNNDLLKKHHLICPEDYITDLVPLTRAPKETPNAGHLKETICFKQHISRSPVDDGYTEFPIPKLTMDSEPMLSNLTLSSVSQSKIPVDKLSSKKSRSFMKCRWKDDMLCADRVQNRSDLTQLENRHNFLKNSRFFPPNAMYGGRSLITSLKKTERMIAGRKKVFLESDPLLPVPVFLSNPPIVIFSEYEIGQTYEMTIALRNLTAVSRRVRVIPPSTSCFSVGLGKFPGEGGTVAPGMSCHYTVRFVPDTLGDCSDFLIVESQALYPLLVPLEARRPPPILTLPPTVDCGACLIGGVKVLQIAGINEGLSCGKFCIMPKNKWPATNFRNVTDAKFVEQGPFGIRPTLFQLYPGQATLLEIVFFPSSVGYFEQTFAFVCDNCQIKDFTVTGLGQLIGLELISVSGEESRPELGELTDLAAEHFVRFDSLNLFATLEKKLLIRNSTHVALPFYWQIMKPNLQALIPGESPDPEKIKYDQDIETAFSITPVRDTLLPHSSSEFILWYTPKELKTFHSVVQMVLLDIPELPRDSEKQEKMLAELEPMTTDVIVLDIDVKGSTEPFKVLLDPYAIILPGENLIGVTIRKQFKMWNNSKAAIIYEWEKIIDCDIIQIEPYTGNLEPNECCELELSFTGGRNRFVIHKLNCNIQHSTEPVVLHVEATFKGPTVSIDIPSLHLGLIKLGEKTLSVLQLDNKSQLPAKWRLQESKTCITARNEKKSQFKINPCRGELPPLSSVKVSVLFSPLQCQCLHTILELKIVNGEDSHVPVYVDVQTPQVCLLSSHLKFNDIYVGIPVQATVTLFNNGRLPAKYTWGEHFGIHSTYCSVTIPSATGSLGPNEEAVLIVELTAYTSDELSDLAICCFVDDMKNPLVLTISGKAKGLHVTYSVFCEKEIDSAEPMSSISDDFQLSFGSEVILHSIVKRYLVLTNHTAIAAPFILKTVFFSGCPLQSDKQGTNLSAPSLIRRTKQFEMHTANKVQYDFAAAVLSDGKGVAFLSQPSTGTLEAFQQLVIEVSAYNNMWGEYYDELICKVGNLEPKRIPLQLSVKGCPIYFQMTGPQHDGEAKIRFGTHISGGDTISRSLRIRNTCPYDIRIDWEMYNQDEDNTKLLDLLVCYGDPFPLKDIDGNEIIACSSDSSESEGSEYSWDKIPESPSTLSHRTDEEEEFESTENYGEKIDGNKLITAILRVHEGVLSDYPYCITPRQIVVPAKSGISIYVSFTPLMLSGAMNKVECAGFALGFLNLNRKGQSIPGKVNRSQGFGVNPIRIAFKAVVKPALLTVEMDDDEGMVFYSVASDLIPDQPVSKILTESVTTHNLKLINSTETPLYFRLLLTKPFRLLGIDPNKSVKTSHSDRDEQGEYLVLHPQQNMLVQVSFCTTFELLTYQNVPADELTFGVQLLESEDGQKKLAFNQHLEIEFNNKTVQQIPLCAYLTVPVLQLSSETVDFGTCFVGQTRTKEIFLLNKSGSKSYWTALIDKHETFDQKEIFSVSPISGILEALVTHMSVSRETLLISFTARNSKKYETAMMIHGVLGEKPCRLQLCGQGSYDEKYEVLFTM